MEPEPNDKGICSWSGVSVHRSFVETLKEMGFTWDNHLGTYVRDNSKPDTPQPLAAISFEVDHFHRAVHAPYGGDCGKKTSDILKEKLDSNTSPREKSG